MIKQTVKITIYYIYLDKNCVKEDLIVKLNPNKDKRKVSQIFLFKLRDCQKL